jgi:predicted HTH domain antitoxin
MNTASIDLPETALIALGTTQDKLDREIVVAAVVKWFELGILSQGKAAEVLGISRAEFLDVLSRYRVSAWQYSKDELDEELSLA